MRKRSACKHSSSVLTLESKEFKGEPKVDLLPVTLRETIGCAGNMQRDRDLAGALALWGKNSDLRQKGLFPVLR